MILITYFDLFFSFFFFFYSPYIPNISRPNLFRANFTRITIPIPHKWNKWYKNRKIVMLIVSQFHVAGINVQKSTKIIFAP